MDACLHQFFTRFNPTMHILHEPTFSLKDCCPFLLLNVVAIGSLFFGSTDAIVRGEFLWRLAQTAAATSWGDVFEGKICGFKYTPQIVTTALFGQTYAMLSRSRRLRTLCQSLHGLAFSWARQFGMFEPTGVLPGDVPDLSASQDDKTAKWRAWIALEIQRRTLLGIYIIDAQLARYAGADPIGKHVTNPLLFTGNDAAFQARTVDSWIKEMRTTQTPQPTFREVFLSLFKSTSFVPACEAHLSILAIMEGFQAILSERKAAHGVALGLPSVEELVDACLRLRKTYLTPALSVAENKELSLLWHNFCLDLASDSVFICQQLCTVFEVPQSLFLGTRQSADPVQLKDWVDTVDARRALLHAAAIQDLAEGLTLGRAYPAHAPAAIFAAATIFCAFSKYGKSTITTPADINWEEVWTRRHQAHRHELDDVDPGTSDGYRFVTGRCLGHERTKTRNIRYSLLTMQMILQTISSQWGISHDMLAVLSVWIGEVT